MNRNADYSFIGGSSTNSIDFPDQLDYPGVRTIEKFKTDTPFGMSPEFTLFTLNDKRVLACRMHGWRASVTRADASKQIFWVLRESGVRRVLGEGGVGAIDSKPAPGDMLVPDDYIDFSMRKDVNLGSDFLLIMRDALCPQSRRFLIEAVKTEGKPVVRQGIYAVTDGRHFESPAEIKMLRTLGADIVGQSLAPEVYLAREISACYASLQLVVNYAEGVVPEWSHEELSEIFYDQSGTVGRIILRAIAMMPEVKDCNCEILRKKTLLRE